VVGLIIGQVVAINDRIGVWINNWISGWINNQSSVSLVIG
jgi:hypothetical protein